DPSTPSLERACKRIAQLCAAILHAQSPDDSVHYPDEQLSQDPIMDAMINGDRVLAQASEIFVATEKTRTEKRTNTIETVGLPIGPLNRTRFLGRSAVVHATNFRIFASPTRRRKSGRTPQSGDPYPRGRGVPTTQRAWTDAVCRSSSRTGLWL